jgi:hypothetical protein
VLEGLGGKAKNRKEQVTWDSLRQYVKEEVAEDARRLFGGAKQVPNETGNLSVIPVLVEAGRSIADAPKIVTKKMLGLITQIEGNKITFRKVNPKKFSEWVGEPMTFTVAKGVKISKIASKGITVVLERGLNNEVFSKRNTKDGWVATLSFRDEQLIEITVAIFSKQKKSDK